MLLNEKKYSVEYDKLISGGRHPIDVTVISIEANQGILRRGTVLSHVVTEAFDGYKVLGENKTDAKFIIADDVDTESTDDMVPVTVYKSGGFNANALIADEGYDIPTSIFENLRSVGIFIE